MQRSSHQRNVLRMVLFSTLLLSLGAATRDDAELDSWITAKAKVALLTADAGNLSRVSVDTFRGRVMLAGPVPLDVDLPRAVEKVRAVPGVRDVRLLLEKPRGVPAIVEDAEIERNVRESLGEERAIQDSEISMTGVKDGTVHLSGRAASIFDHLQALQRAWNVPGVKAVKSDVQTPALLYTKARAAQWREAARNAADQPGPFQDAWITSAVKLLLVSDPQIPTSTVGVDTRDRAVTLFGVVSQPEARSAAEKHVRTLDRVRQVTNAIQVDTRIELDAAVVPDGDVAEQLHAALADYGPVAGSDIQVEVTQGVVKLSGRVPTDEHALAASLYARSVPGVRAVENDLKAESR